MIKWIQFNCLYELRNYSTEKSKKYGYVYIVEYGNFVKIGKSIEPKNRIMSINNIAINYAGEEIKRILLSIKHENFSENEKILHSHFSECRVKKGELFKLTIEEFKSNLPSLNFVIPKLYETEVNEGLRYRNKVLDNYFERVESDLFYDRCISNIEWVEKSEFNKLLLDYFTNDGNYVIYSKLNKDEFIQLTLICNSIFTKFQNGYKSEVITNYIIENFHEYYSITNYIKNELLEKKERFQ